MNLEGVSEDEDMREIGEIHIETETDPYTEGPSTKRCRAVVRDSEGTHLAHIDFTVENTPVPVIHMKDEANRRPSHVLGSLIRAADRIVIDELNPTVLDVASDFIDVPWEKVVVAGPSAELEYKAVAVGDRLFLTHPEWEGEGISLAQTGEYVEISDRLAGKLAYQSPNNLISGRAAVRLPVHTGETLADDMSLLDEARCHRCVGLTEHLAVQRADMVPATFGELDAAAVGRALGVYLRPWADIEAATPGRPPTVVLDLARDGRAVDLICRTLADRLRVLPQTVEAGEFCEWTEEKAESFTSEWRENVVTCAAGRLRAEISRDPARFGATGVAPAHGEIAEGLDEAFGMYAIAPCHRDLLEHADPIPCRFLLDGHAADREVARSIADWEDHGAGPWNPAEAGVADAYATCTAQWICETQGTDLASVVNGRAEGPFADTMRLAVLDQAAWSLLPGHSSWDVPDCSFSIRAAATLGQIAAAEVYDPQAGWPATVGTVPPSPASTLMLSTPHRLGGDDFCDTHAIPLEKSIDIPSDRVSAVHIIDHPYGGRAIAAMHTADGRGIGSPIQNRQASTSRIKF